MPCTSWYSDAELALIENLRSQDVDVQEIRRRLIFAGFSARSIDGLARRLRRSKGGRPVRTGRYDPKYGDPVASDDRVELKRLKQSDEKFCAALLRERPQTGVNHEAGTAHPRPWR
jgi:hypothetical protein